MLYKYRSNSVRTVSYCIIISFCSTIIFSSLLSKTMIITAVNSYRYLSCFRCYTKIFMDYLIYSPQQSCNTYLPVPILQMSKLRHRVVIFPKSSRNKQWKWICVDLGCHLALKCQNPISSSVRWRGGYLLWPYYKVTWRWNNPIIYLSVLEIVSACVLSSVWLFPNPWTVAHQDPLSMEFSRQEYWSVLPFPPPGYLPNPGIEPESLTLVYGFFTTASHRNCKVLYNLKL